MKKLLLLVMCAILALSFVGCSNGEDNSGALLKYINEDMLALNKIEDEFIAAYNSKDYEVLSTTGAEISEKWIKEAAEVADSIEVEEIKEVHKLYQDYVAKNSEAMTALIEYYKDTANGDADSANNALDEAGKIYDEYDLELQTIMKKNGVEYEE